MIISEISFPTVVALGFFDGVHIGHTALISKAKELAKNGVKSTIYTLDTHPSVLFGRPTPMITPGESRIKLLEACKTDYLYLQKTDAEFLNISPEDFVNNILIEKLGAVHIVSGENYTFGKNKSGNSDMLKRFCAEKGIKYTVVPFSRDNNNIISSSLIRALLADGKLSDANRMLGRPFSLSGNVIRCREVGSSLGFPTANIMPQKNSQLPMSGVYATNTLVGGKSYPSITNVGTAPTFSENNLIIESHILDFDHDIYSQNIIVEFLKLLRPQQKFSSPEKLIEQLKKDTTARRKI